MLSVATYSMTLHPERCVLHFDFFAWTGNGVIFWSAMLCFYCLLSSDIFFPCKHIQQVKQSFVIFHINVVENVHEQRLCQYFGEITIACQQAAEIDLGQGK